MRSQTLIYIAGTMGLLAIVVGGWFFYQTLGTTNINSMENQGDSNQLIFGEGATPKTESETKTATSSEESGSGNAPSFGQIVSEPVAGYMTYKDSAGGPSVVYMERGTGFIYTLSLQNNTKKRLSNTTIPRSVESVFVSTSTVVVRYESEDKAQTLLGNIRGDGVLNASILASDIRQVITEPDSQSIFYLRETDGGIKGYLVKPKQNPKEVFSSPLKEWTASFLSKDKILLVTSASVFAPSRAVLLDTSKNSESLLLSGNLGLVVLGDSTVSQFFYSEGDGRLFISSLLDLKKSTTTEITLDTLSEKCAWGKGKAVSTIYCGIPLAPTSGNYPDDWYMGLTHFSDDLWSLNTKSGAYKFLASPRKEAGQSVDAISLSTTPEGDYLLFINKDDLSLWILKLKD